MQVITNRDKISDKRTKTLFVFHHKIQIPIEHNILYIKPTKTLLCFP